MKRKTNEQAIRSFLKDLDTIETAILRERLNVIAQITKNSIKENRAGWQNPLVSVEYYEQLCSKIEKHLGFEK